MQRSREETEELLHFINLVLEHNLTQKVYSDKFETEACWALIKFLIDGEIPSYVPISHYGMEKVYLLYYLIPESLRPKALTLVAAWKEATTVDPDYYKHNSSSPKDKQPVGYL